VFKFEHPLPVLIQKTVWKAQGERSGGEMMGVKRQERRDNMAVNQEMRREFRFNPVSPGGKDLTRAVLLLEDGTVVEGVSFGAQNAVLGEVVFNTSMSGYQEILTDPSYCDQMVVMTYPLIGNYGINRDDSETLEPFAKALIVRDYAESGSNWRLQDELSDWLKQKGIIGISGVDTRMLTRIIRRKGTMKAAIGTGDITVEQLRTMLNQPLPRDQVKRVSTPVRYRIPGTKEKVVLIDFGSKHGILRHLTERGCNVTVVPYNTTAEEIMTLCPDGVVLSNGPGDPEDVPEAIETISRLIGRVPLFGICLGHQLLALASGAKTEKMVFGHRGGNHPVKELTSGKILMTSQNHSYTVNLESVKGTPLKVTHINQNDGTVEGLAIPEQHAFSVQFHPEASPGPEDSGELFARFIEMIAQAKEVKHA
jgi:carbamoyl-phosphate synthase small subunit